MTRYKWCCGGNHAVMVAPLWPIKIKGVKWFTALYKCPKCGAYTRRGETNQLKEWTTFVKFLNARQANRLAEIRKRIDALEAVSTYHNEIKAMDTIFNTNERKEPCHLHG